MTEPQQPFHLGQMAGHRPPQRRWLVPTLAAAVAVLAAVIIVLAVTLLRGDDTGDAAAAQSRPSPSSNPLRAAQRSCGGEAGTALEDGGKTLVIDGAGEEDFTGVDLPTLRCLLGRLHVPGAVSEQMYQTRALDGRQSATWGDGYAASWTYHPDDGLDIIVTHG